MTIDWLFYCFIALTLLSGWHQGGFRVALQFLFWLPAFAAIMLVFYKHSLSNELLPDDFSVAILKEVFTTYFIISLIVWLIDRVYFRMFIKLNLNERKALYANKIAGVVVGGIKVAVVFLSISLLCLTMNNGRVPQWMFHSAVFSASTELAKPLHAWLLRHQYITMRRVVYDKTNTTGRDQQMEAVFGKQFWDMKSFFRNFGRGVDTQ